MDVTSRTPRGLTLKFFKEFITCHGGRGAFEGLSTSDVCRQFVLPYTAESRLSLVDHVALVYPETYVKSAEWFVSHAWSYNYIDVVDALESFVSRQGQDDSVSFWFCTFNNNQHEIQDQEHEFDHWFDILEDSLRSIGCVVMVFDSWNNPTTLTRAWCVFEVYAAIASKSQFEIAMPSNITSIFETDGAFYRMLSKIKCEQSNTTVPEDRTRIFKLIQSQIGFTKLDRIVFQALDQWMTSTIQNHIDSSEAPQHTAHWHVVYADIMNDKEQYDACLQHLEQALELYNKLDTEQSKMGKWRMYGRLASLKVRAKEPKDVWEPMFQEALAHQRELFTSKHRITLHTLHEYGMACYRTGEHALGHAMLEECLATKEEHLGMEDMSTLSTQRELSSYFAFIHKHSNSEKAEKQLVDCYERHVRILGEDHAFTSSSRTSLCVWYCEKGQHDLAAHHLEATYLSSVRTLGPEQFFTILNYANYGHLCRLRGDYEAAEVILLECLTGFQKAESSQWISNCSRYLGELYTATSQLDLAESHLNRALEHAPPPPVVDEERSRSLALGSMYLFYKKANKLATMKQLEQFQEKLKESNWTHDTWSVIKCHGCCLPIEGTRFTCSVCEASRFCTGCVEKKVHETSTVCPHRAHLASHVPPSRYVLETMLQHLETQGNATEFDSCFERYEEYIKEYHVPQQERYRKQEPKNSLSSAKSCLALLQRAFTAWWS